MWHILLQNRVKPDQRHLVMSKKEILHIIDQLLEEELKGFGNQSKMESATREAFLEARVRPSAITVNFSGGITKTCWSVTKSDGTYRVVFLPEQGYFSLCVDSDFGPLDIGVHGSALGCFSSV